MTAYLRNLPIEERIRLVEDIWDSIATDQAASPLTDEQKEELDRRLNAYESDGLKGRLAVEAIAGIRKRLWFLPLCMAVVIHGGGKKEHTNANSANTNNEISGDLS